MKDYGIAVGIIIGNRTRRGILPGKGDQFMGKIVVEVRCEVILHHLILPS